MSLATTSCRRVATNLSNDWYLCDSARHVFRAFKLFIQNSRHMQIVHKLRVWYKRNKKCQIFYIVIYFNYGKLNVYSVL